MAADHAHEHADDDLAVPSSLRVAAAVAVTQVTAGIVVVLLNDRFPIPGRLLLTSLLALGYVFARGALHLRAGATFGLLLLELSALLVAVGAAWPDAVRAGAAVAALLVIALVLASLHAFPSAPLPS